MNSDAPRRGPRISFARRIPPLTYDEQRQRQIQAEYVEDTEAIRNYRARRKSYEWKRWLMHKLSLLFLLNVRSTILCLVAIFMFVALFKIWLTLPPQSSVSHISLQLFLHSLWHSTSALFFCVHTAVTHPLSQAYSVYLSYILLAGSIFALCPDPSEENFYYLYGDLQFTNFIDELTWVLKNCTLHLTGWSLLCFAVCLMGIAHPHVQNRLVIFQTRERRYFQKEQRLQRQVDFTQVANTLERHLPRDMVQLGMDFNPDYSRYVEDGVQRRNNSMAYRRYGLNA